MAAGNHGFDYGTEQFLANAARASFPILAANVYKDGHPLFGIRRKQRLPRYNRAGWQKIGFSG